MALKIRLARGGSKKRPYYRIVVAEALGPRDGNFIEKLGTFNPLLPKDKTERLTLNEERIKYWLSTGAQPTDRVEKFLAGAGLVKAPAARNNPTKGKPKAKAQERVKMAEEAVKAASDAADAARAAEAAAVVAAAEAAAAPAETPAEA